MIQPRFRIIILIGCAFLCVLILTGVVLFLSLGGTRKNLIPGLGSGTVHFDGFLPPGSETQQELELYAKSGINIRDAAGVVRPVIIDVEPAKFSLKNAGTISVVILSTAKFNTPVMVDPISLTFGRTGYEKSFVSCNSQGRDVNEDGLLDLVCNFTVGKTALQATSTVSILRGATIDKSMRIEGMGAISIID